jgi:ATP-dependent Lhr-like helicase
VERARRRALAALRKQIEAVELPVFAAFLQRWQRVDPRDRMTGPAGVRDVIHQLAGMARPAGGWERDYLPSRIREYDPRWLSEVAAGGEIVWTGDASVDESSGVLTLARIRFFERGTGGLWLGPSSDARVGEAAARVLEVLREEGASLVADLQGATQLGMVALRAALHELVAASLVTNDTIEALREVARWRPIARDTVAPAGDPARWLPADFTPSPGRPVAHRRPNLRRLPKWRRPDRPGGAGHAGWIGRWSVVRRTSTLGAFPDDADRAARVARQWLERYGVVTRDWWRRERPPIDWRAIYRELRRLELRGEVRRGYFVRGLAGAQFALPQAVEQLRAAATDPDPPLVVMAATDPANPYSLVPAGIERDPLSRPRGSGALLVTRKGRVVANVEGRGRRIAVGHGATEREVTEIAEALAAHLSAGDQFGRRGRGFRVATIDGRPALASRWLDAFLAAGYRREATGLRCGGTGY